MQLQNSPGARHTCSGTGTAVHSRSRQLAVVASAAAGLPARELAQIAGPCGNSASSARRARAAYSAADRGIIQICLCRTGLLRTTVAKRLTCNRLRQQCMSGDGGISAPSGSAYSLPPPLGLAVKNVTALLVRRPTSNAFLSAHCRLVTVATTKSLRKTKCR